VSAAIASFLATIHDGSTVVFKAGGTYRVDTGITVAGTGLVIEGNGATLRSSGAAAANSLVTLWRAHGATIRNLHLVGGSPTPGVYSLLGQHAHGIRIYESTDTDISGITIAGVWGHGVLVSDNSSGVHFHDSQVASSGVMGVAVMTGSNVLVEHNTFGTIGYGLFDIEPDFGTVDGVIFRNNTAGVISQVAGKRFFFGANGAVGSIVRNVVVSGNTISGSPLDTYVTIARRTNIVFTNNTSSVAAAGPVLIFAHVDGLTVTGNVQPLKTGSLASITDSTNVVYR
jgi:Right handed beta helix region